MNSEVNFIDQGDSLKTQVGLPVIALRRDQVVQKLLFKSIRTFHEDFLISKNGSKFAILVRLADSMDAPPEEIVESSEATAEPTQDDADDNTSHVKMKEQPRSFFDITTKKNSPSFIIQGEMEEIDEAANEGDSVMSNKTNTSARKVKINYTLMMYLLSLFMIGQSKLDTLRYDDINLVQRTQVEDLIAMVDRIYQV